MNARTGVNFHRLVKTVIQQGRRQVKTGGVTFLTRPTPELPRQLVSRVGYVEDFDEPRTMHGKRRVSARRGWAGEKDAVFTSL